MHAAFTKMYNRITKPELISDREICHHLLLMPEYLCTRKFSTYQTNYDGSKRLSLRDRPLR